MRADTNDVAFRLLIALGEVWDNLTRAGIDPSRRGLHVTSDFLGGYHRISAGPGSHSRVIVEWNESSRHLRVLRCEEWSGFEATIAATVQLVRKEAITKGIAEAVDSVFAKACQEPAPSRRTIAIAPGERGRLVGARRA